MAFFGNPMTKEESLFGHAKKILHEYFFDCFKFGAKHAKKSYYASLLDKLHYLKYFFVSVFHFLLDWNYIKASAISVFHLLKNNKILLFFFFLLDILVFIFVFKIVSMKKRRKERLNQCKITSDDSFSEIKHRHQCPFDEQDTRSMLRSNNFDDELVVENVIFCMNELNKIDLDESTFHRIFKKCSPIISKMLSLSIYHQAIEEKLIKCLDTLQMSPPRKTQSLDPEPFFKTINGRYDPKLNPSTVSNEKINRDETKRFDFVNLKKSLENLQKIESNVHLSPLMKDKIENFERHQLGDRTMNRSRSCLDFSSD